MKVTSALFLPFIYLSLFEGHLSTNPESVLVQSPEDDNERTGKMQREENKQRAFISFDGPYSVVVAYMRPVVSGPRIVWREVSRERVDRFRGSNPVQDGWKGVRNNPPNSRRPTERSNINVNRRTTIADIKPQLPPNRVNENNNNNAEKPKSINTSFATTESEEVLQNDNPKPAIIISPKKISPDSNFFAGIVNDFTFKLLETLNLESNFVVSPLSIFVALSMSYLGSDGDTKAQMEQAMGMNNNSVHGEHLHKGITDLLKLVMEESPSYELFVANGMFLGKNFTPDAQFEENIKKYYDAEMKTLDFENSEQSLPFINEWVSKSTKNMITKILNSPPPVLTRLMLLNAIFFKGTWKVQFPLHLTQNGKFHTLDGKEKEVPIMKLFDETFPVYRSDDLKHSFIKLPYEGDQLSMIIALPYGERDIPMPTVTDQILCYVRDAMVETNLGRVALPKFRLEYKKSLIRPLQELGITDIFNRNAVDLRKLRKENDVYVSAIMHKAVIDVNEVGTTAAAVTSVNFVGLSYRNKTKFEVDHPFAFYIVHEPTGLVLFYGKVFDLEFEGNESVDPRENARVRVRPSSQTRG